MNTITIKIDGPVGSGKSTLEKLLREFLIMLENNGQIFMVLGREEEHEIKIEVDGAVKARLQ